MYIRIKNNPSLFVISCPVLIIKIEKTATTIVNILTIKNGEKSTISNGLINATMP
jgi:hypothetical protein